MVTKSSRRDNRFASRVSKASIASATQDEETIASAADVLPMLVEQSFPRYLQSDRRHDSSWPYLFIMILGIALVSGALGPF